MHERIAVNDTYRCQSLKTKFFKRSARNLGSTFVVSRVYWRRLKITIYRFTYFDGLGAPIFRKAVDCPDDDAARAEAKNRACTHTIERVRTPLSSIAATALLLALSGAPVRHAIRLVLPA
jgi:hypothetical protein